VHGISVLERNCRELRRPGKGDLDRPGACSRRNGRSRPVKGMALFELRSHDPADIAHGRRRCWGPLRVVAPTPGHRVTRVESIHCVDKAAHEITAPQFVIREDTQAKFLLLLQYPRNMAILQGLEPCVPQVTLSGAKSFQRDPHGTRRTYFSLLTSKLLDSMNVPARPTTHSDRHCPSPPEWPGSRKSHPPSRLRLKHNLLNSEQR
jgi:hypothetical protein